MPLTFKDIDFKVDLPDIPSHASVVSHTPPCARDRDDTMRALAEVLQIDLKGTAQVPHGYAVGSDRGQVEVFSASGAVRARNAERLAAYPDERRKWSEVGVLIRKAETAVMVRLGLGIGKGSLRAGVDDVVQGEFNSH